MKRLANYIRVSDMGERDEDSVQTQTIRQQAEGATAICSLSQAKVTETVIAKNASGGKSWPEPKLAELIRRVDAGEFDGIVVYDLSRFGRHLAALEVIERWAEEGKVFLSASDKFDATTASGRMCLRMMMVVARYYWEAARDRFAESQGKAFDRGAHIGRTPFGYLRITEPKHPQAGCLYPDPETAPIVTEAFERAAADGLHAAMNYLNVAAPGRRWETDDVRRMLRLRTYLGEVKLGDVRKRGHTPLTTLDTFTTAQTEPGKRATNGDYVLSKLAVCAECGEGLTGQLQSIQGKGKQRRMRCSNAACKGGSSISADALDAHVRAVLRAELGTQTWHVRFAVDGLEDARRALIAAEDERQRFAVDTEWIGALGPEAAKANALAFAAKVEEARQRYEAIADYAARSQRLPGADELDDDQQLLRAIGAVVGSITVARGRRGGRNHPPVSTRVVIRDIDGVVLDLDDGAREAAA